MPTIAEWLDGLVEHTLRAYEEQCWACDDDGIRRQLVPREVPCDLCDENGRAKYDFSKPCALCHGTKTSKEYEEEAAVCDVCGGERVIKRPMWDPYVQANILSACMGAISRARSEENFVTMNEAIDWAERYLLDVARNASSFISEEDMKSALDRLKRAGNVVPKPHVELSGGALTPEELAELGIEPEASE